MICFVPTKVYTATNKEDYELQEKCARDAEARFNKDFKEAFAVRYTPDVTNEGKIKIDTKGNPIYHQKTLDFVYVNHFNKKLNRCFMRAYVQERLSLYHDRLVDVNEKELYGSFDVGQELNEKGKEITVCSVKGKRECHNQRDWEAFIKPYMEE
jgi:hypothetical protein